jgi:hypothetical protein
MDIDKQANVVLITFKVPFLIIQVQIGDAIVPWSFMMMSKKTKK